MPASVIPSSLIEQMRLGRAVLVVGPGAMGPSVATWTALLTQMAAVQRENASDEASERAVAEVAALIESGRHVQAVSYLARAVGEVVCDTIVADAWSEVPDSDALASYAALPFRHVWTTFPGDALARALEAHRPADWPSVQVHDYVSLQTAVPRHRSLVKLLGGLDNFVVTPRTVRKALAHAVNFRDYVRETYVHRTLVFVGFRPEDPDFVALLERLFAAFEAPQGRHYMVGPSFGAVMDDELLADHHIEVLAPAEGSSVAAHVLAWCEALAVACREQAITLAHAEPAADDVEGWIERLGDEATRPQALAMLEVTGQAAQAAGEHATTARILMARIEYDDHVGSRTRLLGELAACYVAAGQHEDALEAALTSCQLNPGDAAAALRATELAAKVDGWSRFVEIGAEIARDPNLAPALVAAWCVRIADAYGEKLGRGDYAVAALRRGLEVAPEADQASERLCTELWKQGAHGELAIALGRHAARRTLDDAARVKALLQLAELYDANLNQPSQAEATYREALAIDPMHDIALAALERCSRRAEDWPGLAKILDRRVENAVAAGNPDQAMHLRRELAALRAEKLGDFEGAIAKYQAALQEDPQNLAAHRALIEIFDKTGRVGEYVAAVERFAEVAEPGEQPALWRRVAAELEAMGDEPATQLRRQQALQAWLRSEPGSAEAHRQLARHWRQTEAWPTLAAHLLDAQPLGLPLRTRIEFQLEAADVYATRINDPFRAIEAAVRADGLLQEPEAHWPELALMTLQLLARLYEQSGAPDRAIETQLRLAEFEPPEFEAGWPRKQRAAARAHAASLVANQGDVAKARSHYAAALVVDPACGQALRALAELELAAGDVGLAADYAERAEAELVDSDARAELLWRVAQAAPAALALRLGLRVLTIQPNHLAALEQAALSYADAHAWAEAYPLVARRVALAIDDDRYARGKWLSLHGLAAKALHQLDVAETQLRAALDATPESVEAAMALAEVLASRAEIEGGDAAQALWREIDKRYRDILARHRNALAESQIADIWYRLGVAARAVGEPRNAEAAFRRALERLPHHVPSLTAMAQVAEQACDWQALAHTMQALAEAAPANDAGARYEALGDLWRDRLRKPTAAAAAYLECVRRDAGLSEPRRRLILHKLLGVYTDAKEWRLAVDVLSQLAALEPALALRAKLNYAAASLARDELQDSELAVAKCLAALDAEPGMTKAADMLERMLHANQDWKGLVRAYRRQLRRLHETEELDAQYTVWRKLADVAWEQLGDAATAIEALETALAIRAEGTEARAQLVELYLAQGATHATKAIAELQTLIARAPEQVAYYKALGTLYRDTGELDKAWCVARVLVVLDAAAPEEREFYARYHGAQLQSTTKRLTEEIWQTDVMHPEEDRYVGAMFASTWEPLAATTAKPSPDFGLHEHQRLDVRRGERHTERLARYVGMTLALPALPYVFVDEHATGIQVANVAALSHEAPTDHGAYVPSVTPTVVLGKEFVTPTSDVLLAFELGKRMAYLRPERYLHVSLGSDAALTSALAAVVAAAQGNATPVGEGEPSRYARALQDVAVPVRDHLAALAQGLGEAGIEPAAMRERVGQWRMGAERTANRAGFIMCNDLEVALSGVAGEVEASPIADVKQRMRDLLAYAVSEQYFAVRAHLGYHIAAG